MDEPAGSERATWARAIHARLLRDDPTAPHELLAHYLDPLADWLERRNPGLGDPHHYTTAAADALIALLKNPRSYDPDRRPLWGYLRMSAQGDLRNLLRAERRHSARRAPLEAVELSLVGGNSEWAGHDDPAHLTLDADERDAPPPPTVAGLTPGEERVLALMRAGERKTIAYALALGLDGLPASEQRRAVKRVKDRLQKRLVRGGGGR